MSDKKRSVKDLFLRLNEEGRFDVLEQDGKIVDPKQNEFFEGRFLVNKFDFWAVYRREKGYLAGNDGTADITAQEKRKIMNRAARAVIPSCFSVVGVTLSDDFRDDDKRDGIIKCTVAVRDPNWKPDGKPPETEEDVTKEMRVEINDELPF